MRLKDVSTLSPTYSGPYINGSVSFVPMDSIRTGCLNPLEISFEEGSAKYTFFANGDLLIAKVTPCFENGNIAIAERLQNEIGFGSSELFVLRMNSRVLNSYMFYLGQTSLFRDSACATMCGVAGLKRISPLFMRTFEFDFPDLDKQQKIVSYLDERIRCIDRYVSLCTQKKDAYIQLKKSIINDAVTKGLNPNVPMKNSGIDWIGMIPENWNIRRLKYFVSATKGKQVEYFDDPVDGSMLVLNVEALRSDEIENPNYGIPTDKNQICTPSDMLVIYDGSGVGEFLRGKNGIVAATTAKLHIDEKKVLKEYFWLLRYEIEKELKAKPTGIGIPHLNPTLFNNFEVPIPPIDEQKAIVSVIGGKCDKIDSIVSNIDKQIEKYNLLKRSLINEVITGQRAV